MVLTLLLSEPPNYTVTTTEYWSQSYATTTTITAPPGETDTVIIREPPNHTVTTTEYWSNPPYTTTLLHQVVPIPFLSENHQTTLLLNIGLNHMLQPPLLLHHQVVPIPFLSESHQTILLLLLNTGHNPMPPLPL